MARQRLSALLIATVLATSTVAAQGTPGSASETARARLRFIEGSFRVSSAAAGDTASVWRFRPVLGGKYLELEAVQAVAFRVTVGFDSTSQRYRLSLLDAGTGAFDVYDGEFNATGALVLQNPHFWRITLTPSPTGITWRFEHSADSGATWKGSPATELRRMRVVEHP